MRLAELLAALDAEELERLAAEHLRGEEPMSRSLLCNTLEGILRSYTFLHELLINRQPPTFSILVELLDAPDFCLPSDSFRACIGSDNETLCRLVDNREILGRDRQLHLYRRVLCEARRSDLRIDPGEAAILGVLRRELGIAQVEHFLIEHHSDLREFWFGDQSFLRELNLLRSSGLVFARGGMTCIASDVAPLVQQVLGIDLPRRCARRLYEMLSNTDLSEALARIAATTGGTKEERIQRMVLNYIQARAVLRELAAGTLRELCKELAVNVSGSKDDLVERIISTLAAGGDAPLAREDFPVTPPPEPRALDTNRFSALFYSLKGTELADVLKSYSDLRQSGAKSLRIATLFQSPYCERTLLGQLVGRDLENLLERLKLKISGSKSERIDRLLSYFATVDLAVVAPSEPHDDLESDGLG